MAPDARSVVSQAYSSNFPIFATGHGPFVPPHLAGGKRGGTFSAYAQSIISQDVPQSDAASVVGSSIAPSERGIAYNQADRLNRGDLASEYGGSSVYDYKSTAGSQLDAQSQSGVTDF